MKKIMQVLCFVLLAIAATGSYAHDYENRSHYRPNYGYNYDDYYDPNIYNILPYIISPPPIRSYVPPQPYYYPEVPPSYYPQPRQTCGNVNEGWYDQYGYHPNLVWRCW